MKTIQLEKIEFEKKKSFKLFSPSLRNYFYWHYHPEYELVYVEGDSGLRHVGAHMSGYTQSDLVFIGPNIPHLNFDYKLEKEYQQVVVQLREDFLGSALSVTPEFSAIDELFRQAGYGLSFFGRTKQLVSDKLKKLPHLDDLEQLTELLKIFHILATSEEIEILNKEDLSLKLFHKDKIRMGAVYEYIDQHYYKKPDVNVIAEKVHLTTPAFCRYFKQQTQMTFTDFVNLYRLDVAKNLLIQDKSVTEACYAVGFGSLSYFNKLFKNKIGCTPSAFKKDWIARNIKKDE